MKKWISAAVVILSLSFLPTAQADAPVPGSIDDPVITKSYFDQNIQQVVKDEVAKALAGGGNVPGGNAGGNTGSGGSASDLLSIVQLKAGQTLMVSAGSEVIVRRGKTLAVSTDGESIPDVTAGKDVNPGGAVEQNHLLVFPRDGRGLTPDPKNTVEIWVMVRGGYTIK